MNANRTCATTPGGPLKYISYYSFHIFHFLLTLLKYLKLQISIFILIMGKITKG